ncbi:MAG: energy-coupling factor ABC transporter ATP-binding protein [Ignisphaera sp.]|nr:energy-coupling factor ABC transporter ATP-binding protein [Ignisphaera sp.]MCX8168238.1 energy-coupling factor ABC transporter ATP-binding protein [Ignisphaera sp.]MDW8084894.1 ABC transporter ATP-binding protein [Ignisphaera sp.]
MELSTKNLYYKYPGASHYALRDITYKFIEGKTYLITGPNGAGKTTLLLILSGLLKPTQGEVLLDGTPIHGKELYRRFFGVLFQNPDLMLFNPTVYDEIIYSVRQICNDFRRINEDVDKWLNFFELDRSILDRQTHTLSYGYKKIVALISILIYEPKILILDEPHTNLSKKYIKKIKDIIAMNASKNGINVIASHSLTIYRDTADCVIVLNNGMIRKIVDLKRNLISTTS